MCGEFDSKEYFRLFQGENSKRKSRRNHFEGFCGENSDLKCAYIFLRPCLIILDCKLQIFVVNISIFISLKDSTRPIVVRFGVRNRLRQRL